MSRFVALFTEHGREVFVNTSAVACVRPRESERGVTQWWFRDRRGEELGYLTDNNLDHPRLNYMLSEFVPAEPGQACHVLSWWARDGEPPQVHHEVEKVLAWRIDPNGGVHPVFVSGEDAEVPSGSPDARLYEMPDGKFRYYTVDGETLFDSIEVAKAELMAEWRADWRERERQSPSPG